MKIISSKRWWNRTNSINIKSPKFSWFKPMASALSIISKSTAWSTSQNDYLCSSFIQYTYRFFISTWFITFLYSSYLYLFHTIFLFIKEIQNVEGSALTEQSHTWKSRISINNVCFIPSDHQKLTVGWL
jgi:hypothetical protein